MSEELEPKTTEDGYAVDADGVILSDPADVPQPTVDQESESENPAEVPDSEASSVPATGQGVEVLDILLGAQESAALLSDILRRKINVPSFRQLVMDGHAPTPEPLEEDKSNGPSKWSMMALRRWATNILDEEERAAQREAAAAPEADTDSQEEPAIDFLLAARDASGFLSETLGRRIHAAAFRQLVMDGNAPAPFQTTDGTAKWSMRALHTWAQEILVAEAEAEADALLDPLEEATKEGSAFAAWVHERLHRLESFDDRTGGWCSQWWDHPEAVDRFHALWLAYTAAESEGELSGWWVNHWDRQFTFLFSKSGVFSQCADGRHKNATDPDHRQLENEAPPATWLLYPDRVPPKGSEGTEG